MDSKSLKLRREIGAVIPSSIDRAKQFAKQVNKFYRGHQLSQCQEATAHVFGHADWHCLDQAIKLGGKARQYDEELDQNARVMRFNAQMGHLALDMCGIDPDDDYLPPTFDKLGEAPLADRGGFVRLEKAGMKFHRLLCGTLVWELLPTAQRVPHAEVVHAVPDARASQDTMAQFPTLIGRWWNRCVPGQREVGHELMSFDWNKDRPSSVLSFAGYWGELCMHYSTTIDWTMCSGTAYVLGCQYTVGKLKRLQVFHDSAGNDPTLNGLHSLEDVQRLYNEFMIEFLHAYPRDDMIALPPKVMRADADNAIKIISSKTSKKGTWKRESTFP